MMINTDIIWNDFLDEIWCNLDNYKSCHLNHETI